MFIKGRFTTLNEYIKAERAKTYHAAAKIKREQTRLVELQVLGQKIKTPCKLKFTWYRRDTRTDLDNVVFAKKWVMDGLVKAKVIPDDTMKHITGFIDEFEKTSIEGVKIERVEE